MNLNLCESCKTVECSFRKDGRLVHACHSHDPITLADLAAKNTEITKLKDEIHSERAHWQDRIVRERNDILDRATNGVLTAIAPLAERPCIGEAHGSGFVLVGRVWHDENEVRKAAESLGLASTEAGPTPDYTGEGSAWVPPVEARAVVVPPDSPSKYRWRSVLDMIPKDAWLICIDTDARIFYAKQGPRSGGWTFHGAHAFRDPTHWLDVIPENRLLRDGMVQVPERELACMRAELEYRRAASEEAPESVLDPLWDAFDALRANQGGAEHGNG